MLDTTVQQVDTAQPIDAATARVLMRDGVRAVGFYCGGINNGGRGWQPGHLAPLAAIGLLLLPIYVGQNVCNGCAALHLDARRGELDGQDAVLCAQRFGQFVGPLCLDIEWDTAIQPGVLEYVDAWCRAVYFGNYTPVVYAPGFMLRRYRPSVPVGCWWTRWVDTSEAPAFHDLSELYATDGAAMNRYNVRGWQYADRYKSSYDLSAVERSLYVPYMGVVVKMPTANGVEPARWFAVTQHTIRGAFLAFWEGYQDKSLATFGYPISEEFTDPHTGLTVQYFERARFEYHGGSVVQLGLVGVEVAECEKLGGPAWVPVPKAG